MPIPPSNVNDVLANCFNSGKLQDKSTPPIIKVNAGNIVKIPSDIKNLGYCLPSSYCFLFANLLKKKIIIIAIIKVIKNISKLFQTGATV